MKKSIEYYAKWFEDHNENITMEVMKEIEGRMRHDNYYCVEHFDRLTSEMIATRLNISLVSIKQLKRNALMLKHNDNKTNGSMGKTTAGFVAASLAFF